MKYIRTSLSHSQSPALKSYCDTRQKIYFITPGLVSRLWLACYVIPYVKHMPPCLPDMCSAGISSCRRQSTNYSRGDRIRAIPLTRNVCDQDQEWWILTHGFVSDFFIRSLHISAVSKVSCAKEDYQTRDLSVNRANNAHIATFLLFPFVPSKPNIERILDVPIRSYVHHDEFAAITHLLVSYFIASGISERLVRNVFGIPEHQIIEYATKQFK